MSCKNCAALQAELKKCLKQIRVMEKNAKKTKNKCVARIITPKSICKHIKKSVVFRHKQV